jgi:hypothetical protein
MSRKTNAELDRLRDYAKTIYLSDHAITQKAIAEKVGVAERTIASWIADKHWADLRKSLMSTKSTQISLLYDQLAALNQEIAAREKPYASNKETDILIKISATIKSLETETSIGEIIQVGRDFIKFVASIDYDLSKQVTAVFDNFINTKVK